MNTKEHRRVIDEYYYACCPYCRMTIAQGKNGTDVFIKCPQCGRSFYALVKKSICNILACE